jgi:hypothetical protein
VESPERHSQGEFTMSIKTIAGYPPLVISESDSQEVNGFALLDADDVWHPQKTEVQSLGNSTVRECGTHRIAWSSFACDDPASQPRSETSFRSRILALRPNRAIWNPESS